MAKIVEVSVSLDNMFLCFLPGFWWVHTLQQFEQHLNPVFLKLVILFIKQIRVMKKSWAEKLRPKGICVPCKFYVTLIVWWQIPASFQAVWIKLFKRWYGKQTEKHKIILCTKIKFTYRIRYKNTYCFGKDKWMMFVLVWRGKKEDLKLFLWLLNGIKNKVQFTSPRYTESQPTRTSNQLEF